MDPVKRPIIPHKNINKFFHILHVLYESVFQYIRVSIIGGKIKPTVHKLNAPIKDKNGPRLGNTAATITEKKNNNKKINLKNINQSVFV